MLLAFTDESYSDAHYYQAALVIDEKDLWKLEVILDEARQYVQGFGVISSIEFHGNEIMSARKGWEPIAGNFRIKSSIFKFIFRRLARINATLIIQGVDVNRLKNRYKYPDSPHEITHKNLLDALDRYAESCNEKVWVISDQIHLQTRLQQLFSIYQIISTGGLFPRYLTNILEIEHVQSHQHSGIQIIDLCAFIFRRFDEHIEGSEKTRKEVIGMWELLGPLIDPKFHPRVWRP